LAEAAALPHEQEESDSAVVAAAEEVLAAGYDRNKLAGTALVVPNNDPNSTDPDLPPLIRIPTPMSKLRYAVTAILAAAATTLIPGVVATLNFQMPGTLFATAALSVLLASCVVLSLVDLDTLYIDLRVF